MTSELQDDELLRGYLLGRLPEEDADRLERRLLAEDDLFELAEAVEIDLLAAVDRGAFTAAEREEVLRKLAASPRGRERLALARALNTLATEKAEKSNILRPVFQSPAIRWMALAASLVMVAGLGWFAWRNGANAPGGMARLAPTPQFHAPVASPPVAPPVVRTPASNPDQTAAQGPPRVSTAVLTLSFMTSRGAEEISKLKLAPGTREIEIQIDEDGLEPAKSFDAVVRSREQETILKRKGLAIGALSLGGRGLALDLPAELLPAGRYEVAVTPQGGEEVVQEFEVESGKHR